LSVSSKLSLMLVANEALTDLPGYMATVHNTDIPDNSPSTGKFPNAKVDHSYIDLSVFTFF